MLSILSSTLPFISSTLSSVFFNVLATVFFVAATFMLSTLSSTLSSAFFNVLTTPFFALSILEATLASSAIALKPKIKPTTNTNFFIPYFLHFLYKLKGYYKNPPLLTIIF